MVLFIPKVKSFGEEFGQSLGGGIGSSFSEALAAKQLGIDPAIFNLPEAGQAAYFKKMFSPDQQLTPLQQSQLNLNQEKLKALQGRQDLFKRLSGNEPEEQFQEEAQLNPQKQNFLSQMPENNLNQLAAFAGQPGEEGIIGNIAKGELEKRKEEEKTKRKSFESERAYHSGYTKETEKKVNELRNSIPKKEMALNFSRNAIETGNLGYFSPDKLADATGMDLFRTAKGAQLITAGKENLLSNMSRVSARAQNIWFEQRLNSMFPKIGQSEEANLITQEMLEGEVALDKAYVNEYERLSDEDENKYGFVKKDIDKRVANNLKTLEKEILGRTSYRMKEIEEQEKGISKLKKDVGKNVIKGTPLTLAMAKLYKEKFGENALKVAEKNGYYIPTIEEFQTFQERPQEFREGL